MTRFICALIFNIAVVALFSGCSFVSSDITVFHSLPKQKNDQFTNYSFEKFEWQVNSLEYNAYKDKIQKYLIVNNFLDKEPSDIIIKFNYGIDNGSQQINSTPIIGPTGANSSFTFGTVRSLGNGYGNFSGTTISNPSLGIIGSSTHSHTEYKRFIKIIMINKKTQEIIYDVTAISSGSSSQINMVIDEMLESIFMDFPGKSGSSKTVEISFKE